MDQHTLIASVAERMADNSLITGLFLAGSHGRGTADEWSDVDLVAVAAVEHHAAIAQSWKKTLNDITPIVFWNELPRDIVVLNAISEDWLRCDLSIVSADRFGRRAQNTVKPLIDRKGIYQALPESLPPRQPDAAKVRYLISEFIRMMGLLPVAAGRGEYVTMVLGVSMMRGHFEALLMQDVPNPDPGGMLHLSKLLPPEHMALLRALPYPGPDRVALIQAHIDLARAFFPRARGMAERLDIEWPTAFETATRRRLEQTLGHEVGWGW